MFFWIVGSLLVLAFVACWIVVLIRPQRFPALASFFSPANVLFLLGVLTVIVGLSACLCYHLRAGKASQEYTYSMNRELYEIVMADRAKVHRSLYAVFIGVALILVGGAVRLLRQSTERVRYDDDAPPDWLE